MVMALIECLLEFNEFLTFHRYFIIVAEAHIELFVFNTLALLWQKRVHILLEILLVLGLMHLMLSQWHQPIFLGIDKDITRFLKGLRMMTLSMINLI
jgi:hypothetical protein